MKKNSLLRFVLREQPKVRKHTNDVSIKTRRKNGKGKTQNKTSENGKHYVVRPWLVIVTIIVGTIGIMALLWFLVPASWFAFLWPLLTVTLLRITDVTLGVFRAVFIMRGRTFMAGSAAGLEASVWLAAAGIVLHDMSIIRGVSFALGVGLGTMIGMRLVRALHLGMVTVRVFAREGKGRLAAELIREMGYGATIFEGDGRDGKVDMVLSVLRRKEAYKVCETLKGHEGLFVTLDSDPVVNSNLTQIKRV